MKIIDVKELSFKYQRKGELVLDKLDFSCEKGTVNVLIGLNGSGKTTLIKILAGLLENYQGGVFIDGKDLKGLSIKERAKKMAYVAQRSNAVDDFPVLDYLLFGTVNKMNFYQSPKEEDKKRVLDCAKQFGITHLLDKKLGEISGGERQIVSICAAIVQDTNLVILDEPTSALDPIAEYNLNKAMHEAAEGKTVFYISHRLSTTRDADRILMLEKGRIIEEGTHEELLAKNGQYAEMWYAQAGKYTA